MTTPLPQLGTLISTEDAEDLAGAVGHTVTAENLAMAELVITMRTGLQISDESIVDSMEESDRYWLAQAVVFQAIWLNGQPDAATRLDVSQSSTDGDAFTLNHDGLMLAPLAKWAICKTTYMSWGSVDVAPTETVLGTGLLARNIEDVGFRRWGMGDRKSVV